MERVKSVFSNMELPLDLNQSIDRAHRVEAIRKDDKGEKNKPSDYRTFYFLAFKDLDL